MLLLFSDEFICGHLMQFGISACEGSDTAQLAVSHLHCAPQDCSIVAGSAGPVEDRALLESRLSDLRVVFAHAPPLLSAGHIHVYA
jgi:hypothetical protein